MGFREQYNAAEKAKTTVKLSAKYIEFKDKGQVIIGRFIRSNAVQSSLGVGTYLQYLFNTDEGMVKFALGRATDAEAGAMLVVGGVYSITYKGKEKLAGGRQLNVFEVVQIEVPADAVVGGAGDVPF